MLMFFVFKKKTAYEMRISDWSSDVCSSDLMAVGAGQSGRARGSDVNGAHGHFRDDRSRAFPDLAPPGRWRADARQQRLCEGGGGTKRGRGRSEERRVGK